MYYQLEIIYHAVFSQIWLQKKSIKSKILMLKIWSGYNILQVYMSSLD